MALQYYQLGLEISQRNFQKDPKNYSVANDLAVDSLLVVKLHLMKFEEAKTLFDLAVKNDMVDGVIESLLNKHQLNWLP